MSSLLLAVSKAANLLYVRSAAGVWSPFSPAPVLTGGVGEVVVGVPNTGGDIILWRTAPPNWCHFDAASSTWSYKVQASVATFATSSGFALDEDHVYVAGQNAIEVYSTSTGLWTVLPSAFPSGLTRIHAFSPTDIWAVGGSNPSFLYHYDGIGWTDLAPAMEAALGWSNAWPISDVWGYPGSSTVYVATSSQPGGLNAPGYVVSFDGATWTANPTGFQFSAALWGSAANNAWVIGRGSPPDNYRPIYWNGATWVLQTGMGLAASLAYNQGKIVYGIDSTTVGCCINFNSPREYWETVDGSTWTQPALPGPSTTADALGAQIFPDPAPVVVSEGTPFPHDIYLMFIQTIRDSDQAEGNRLLLRWLEGAQIDFEATYARILSLLEIYDVEKTSFAALKFVKWIVGLTAKLDFLTNPLTEEELRRLVSIAVATWKRKGTEAGLQEVLEAVAAREVRIVNYFYFRTLIDSVELGFEEIPNVDPWLIDPAGFQTSIVPSSVTLIAPGVLSFGLADLLGVPEAVPHQVRLHCVQTRVTGEATSFWDGSENSATILSSLGQDLGFESVVPADYRIGVDPDEFISDLRITDDGGDLNRDLVENLVRVLRPANERYLIRYVTFLDSFRRTLDWFLASGGVTHLQELGEIVLTDGAADSVLAVVRDNASSWTNYHVSARVSAASSVVSRWFELRFYSKDGDFYAIRIVPTGGLGATFKIDKYVASVRTTLLSKVLPVWHYGTNYTLRADVVPIGGGVNQIRGYVDGTLHGQVTDSDISEGGIELACSPLQTLTATYVEMFQHPMDSVRIGPPMAVSS